MVEPIKEQDKTIKQREKSCDDNVKRQHGMMMERVTPFLKDLDEAVDKHKYEVILHFLYHHIVSYLSRETTPMTYLIEKGSYWFDTTCDI